MKTRFKEPCRAWSHGASGTRGRCQAAGNWTRRLVALAVVVAAFAARVVVGQNDPLTNGDVVTLVGAGLGEAVIVAKIGARGDLRGLRPVNVPQLRWRTKGRRLGAREPSGEQRELGRCPGVRGMAVGGDRGGIPAAERGRVGVRGAGAAATSLPWARRRPSRRVPIRTRAIISDHTCNRSLRDPACAGRPGLMALDARKTAR